MTNNDKVKLNKSGIIALTSQFRWGIIWMIVFFISAWNIFLFRAWIYIIIYFICAIITMIINWKLIPDIFNQRNKMQKGTKKWDEILLVLFFVFLLFINPLVAGLDVGRFQCSSLNNYFIILGIILYIVSIIFIEWALLVNNFFEGTVRIQENRNHKVIKTGPYRIVRHPGYISMIIGNIGMIFIIGSFYMLIVNIIPSIILIIRTYLEDKTLQKELEGYLEYTKEVKYRLYPLIW